MCFLNTYMFFRLALNVRATDDYLMSRHLGLQRQALSLDYLPSLRAMAKSESVRQVTNSKRRFVVIYCLGKIQNEQE